MTRERDPGKREAVVRGVQDVIAGPVDWSRVLTVREVVGAGGTTSQSAYTYFGSREAVVRAGVADLEGRVLEKLGSAPSRLLPEWVLSLLVSEPALVRLLSVDGVPPEADEGVLRVGAQLERLLEEQTGRAGWLVLSSLVGVAGRVLSSDESLHVSFPVAMGAVRALFADRSVAA